MKIFRTLGRALRATTIAVGSIAIGGAIFALADNYAATQGSGTTFASKVISAVNYVQFIICDATTGTSACATVSSGALKVDNSAVTQPVSGTVTANIGNTANTTPILTTIAQGTGFKPASTEKMIQILKEQEFNEKIPAGLPPGTPVAHKTGDITGFHHDAAIVYPPGEKPYVLVVMTEGYQDEKDANRTIAAISQVVWERRADPLAGPEKQPAKPPREGGR